MIVLPAVIGDLAPGIVGGVVALAGYVGYRVEKKRAAGRRVENTSEIVKSGTTGGIIKSGGVTTGGVTGIVIRDNIVAYDPRKPVAETKGYTNPLFNAEP